MSTRFSAPVLLLLVLTIARTWTTAMDEYETSFAGDGPLDQAQRRAIVVEAARLLVEGK